MTDENIKGMAEENDVTDILWTGGWDSTFRVIRLVESGYQVRPHYIVDPGRPSKGLELKTISRITEILNNVYEGRVLELQTTDLESIPVPRGVSDAFDEIRKGQFVGDQYNWLAAYTITNDLDCLELSVHKDDRACELIADFIVEDSSGSFRIGPQAPLPIRQIFGRFSYPLFYMSKSDMKNALHSEVARRVMALTWFCHTPTLGRYPCGHCNPCIYTAQEGLIERLPWHARLRYHCRVYPRLKDILIKFPQIHSALLSTVRHLR